MVCLDTTFLIDLINGRISIDFLEGSFGEEDACVTSPSFIEIFRGFYLKGNLKNVGMEEESRAGSILSSFDVLDLDKDSAIRAGEIEADLINKGEIIDIEDIMIAAICIENGKKLVTRNVKHFSRIKGLDIVGY